MSTPLKNKLPLNNKKNFNEDININTYNSLATNSIKKISSNQATLNEKLCSQNNFNSLNSYNYNMNQDNKINKNSKVKVKSNYLFAFANDHIYSSLCSDNEDKQSNLNQSNFFSVANDSHWFKLNQELNFENIKVNLKDEDDEVICKNDIDNNINYDNLDENTESTLLLNLNDDVIKKNIENIIIEDDLNNAKLDDSSIFSQNYSNILNTKENEHLNPCNNNYNNLYDLNKNTQSFSSIFNNLNINQSNSSYCSLNDVQNNPSSITNNYKISINNNMYGYKSSNINKTSDNNSTYLNTNNNINEHSSNNCFVKSSIHMYPTNKNDKYFNQNSKLFPLNNSRYNNSLKKSLLFNINNNEIQNSIISEKAYNNTYVYPNKFNNNNITNNNDINNRKESFNKLNNRNSISKPNLNINNNCNKFNLKNYNTNYYKHYIALNSNYFRKCTEDKSPYNTINFNTVNNILDTKNNTVVNNTDSNLQSFDSSKQNNNSNANNNIPQNNNHNKNNNIIVNLKSIKPSSNNVLKIYNNLSLEEKQMLDNVLQFCKDSNKCRIIQNKFDEKKDFYKVFFEKAKVHLFEIICDPFGNYVCQKFIETCQDPLYISKFLESITNNMYNIAVNTYGTRGLQKLIEYTSLENDLLIIKNFITTLLMHLIRDNTGNHVIQQAIIFYPKDSNDFFYDEIIKNNNNLTEICKLKQGGCVLNKLFSFSNNNQKIRLCEAIVNNLNELINNEFGNFIIQQIFKFKITSINNVIFNYIKNNVIYLSIKKYSSNVIDKCLLKENFNYYKKNYINTENCQYRSNSDTVSIDYNYIEIEGNNIKNILAKIILDNKALVKITEDKYGNYIVQMLLDVVDKYYFDKMIEILKKKINYIRNSAYGEKIYQRLTTKYKEHFKVPINDSSTLTSSLYNLKN